MESPFIVHLLQQLTGGWFTTSELWLADFCARSLASAYRSVHEFTWARLCSVVPFLPPLIRTGKGWQCNLKWRWRENPRLPEVGALTTVPCEFRAVLVCVMLLLYETFVHLKRGWFTLVCVVSISIPTLWRLVQTKECNCLIIMRVIFKCWLHIDRIIFWVLG